MRNYIGGVIAIFIGAMLMFIGAAQYNEFEPFHYIFRLGLILTIFGILIFIASWIRKHMSDFPHP